MKLLKDLSQLILTAIFTIGLLTSCVPSSSSTNKLSTTSTEDETPISPDLPSSNFFQKDGVTSSTATVELNYENYIYLRGAEVNDHLTAQSEAIPECIISYYPLSTDNKVLVTAAIPKSRIDFSTGAKEYYYIINPGTDTESKNFCQKTGVISKVNTLYPGDTIAYKVSDICVNCNTTYLSSNAMTIVSSNGIENKSINSSYLRITIKLSSITKPDPAVATCTIDSQCTAQGYDCCSGNRCVTAGTLKNDVVVGSSDYIQATAAVAANPNHYVLWPTVYNVCPNSPPTVDTPDDETIVDPNEETTRLRYLYECINPVVGEMSICTTKISSAETGKTYSTENDDLTFESTYSGNEALFPDIAPGQKEYQFPKHSIYEVVYAGNVIYDNPRVNYNHATSHASALTIGPANDDLTTSTSITLNATASSTAPNTDLYIRYQVDGSCVPINSSLARCTKYYTKGQNSAYTNDHRLHPNTHEFKLPQYANTSSSIKVEVDGFIKQQGIHWDLSLNTPVSVLIDETVSKVADTQEVKITYYVDTKLAYPDLMIQKLAALNTVKEICQCKETSNCNLRKVTTTLNGASTDDYVCTYTADDEDVIPDTQKIYMSAKSVPQRLFDTDGISRTKITTGIEQEGTLFEYSSQNLLKPNNASTYIGFNEIYGSFTSNSASAKPAKEVRVKQNRTYDILVHSGRFSSCQTCGSDYNSTLAKLFPNNFQAKGGGYTPDASTTNVFKTSEYRRDDLVFGRACFVPATMIAWTHTEDPDRENQRAKRLQGQHFLYANGYKRDWYGFDYGALIGSFDGVTWFAIGNERRIKADGNKLFLAINAPFGDLTTNDNFTVSVTDATFNLSAVMPESDYETDGAECRVHHQCNTDVDCATQLGWEYSCQDISGVKTSWPEFDHNGSEIPSSSRVEFIKNLLGKIQPGTKRCVYRGAGAPCQEDYSVTNESLTYHRSTKTGLNACAPGYYCQAFLDGVPQAKFNNRINRYGHSLNYRNAKLGTSEDTYGLGAPLIGRPLNYNGTETVSSSTQSLLALNRVSAMCLPGKNVDGPSSNFVTLHSSTPASGYKGDRVNGIGMTSSKTKAANYVASCGVFDSEDNYYHLDSNNFYKTLTNTEIKSISGQQAMSSNLLTAFASLLDSPVTKNFSANQITTATLEADRCLRAPGTPCFSNLDCSVSEFVSNKIAAVDPDDTSLAAIMNKYEIQFWQEGLICGQKAAPTDSDFALNKNKCCRASGSTITIGTLINESSRPTFNNTDIAGIDIDISHKERYSRNTTVYKEIKDGDLKSLDSAPNDQCNGSGGCQSTTDYHTKQYETFDAIATRTCCSSSWVRSFHKEDNGGGHKWGPLKTQKVPKTIFKCKNWKVCPAPGSSGHSTYCGDNGGFECSHVTDPDDPKCLMRSTSNSEAKPVFEWLNTLELAGVPQIKVANEDLEDLQCIVDYDYQYIANNGPMNDTIVPSAVPEYVDSDGNRLLSTLDSTNFQDGIKKIFSEDEVACCLGAGETTQDGDPDSICCTGFINPDTKKCALPDYSNVSLYLNRYISSDGKGLADGLYDHETGFIKSSDIVEQIACNKNICASGVLAKGVALSNLKVPGLVNNQKIKRRFIDGNDEASNYEGMADLFDAGLKWNNDIYCFPDADIPDTPSTNLQLHRCN